MNTKTPKSYNVAHISRDGTVRADEVHFSFTHAVLDAAKRHKETGQLIRFRDEIEQGLTEEIIVIE